MTTNVDTQQPLDDAQRMACRLGMWGLLAHWNAIAPELRQQLLAAQLVKRHERSLDRRVRMSRLGNFKPLHEFNWGWPRAVDRRAIEELMTTGFLTDATNPVLIGPTGVGKTMLAKNIAHAALLRGRTVRVVDAAAMLDDLARNAEADQRRRALHRYVAPALLVIDCLGNNVYDPAQTDLLFAVVSARHLKRSTIVTTALSLSQWHSVLPNATCAHKLVDLVAHRADILEIDADSYRYLEATQRAEAAKARRYADGERPGR